jgi:hypothetical protein
MSDDSKSDELKSGESIELKKLSPFDSSTNQDWYELKVDGKVKYYILQYSMYLGAFDLEGNTDFSSMKRGETIADYFERLRGFILDGHRHLKLTYYEEYEDLMTCIFASDGETEVDIQDI